MILALQFYDGDLEQSMSLARLIADIEPTFREDVIVALVYQPGTKIGSLVDKTVAHCRRRFPVELVESPLGGQGHPSGCTALWAGTVLHYFERWKTGEFHQKSPRVHDSICTLDAGDGVPLYKNWIDILIGQHWQTVRLDDKSITGTPYYLGDCPLHVNPNAVFDFRVFEQTKLLTDIPQHDGTINTHFDIYHRDEMLANASLSSIVRTDWHGDGQKLTSEKMRQIALNSVWLHGYKDPDLTWLARKHLSENLPPPQIHHYDLDNLRRHETVRRHFEEFRRNPC